MSEVYITRRERFSAAHRLFREDWDDQKNLKVFGKCSNPNWHGHNYVLYVTVKGERSEETGFVMDLSILGRIVREHVIAQCDHKNLNMDVDFLEDVLTTTENLAVAFWDRLVDPIKENGGTLHCIKIQETENNYVKYYG